MPTVALYGGAKVAPEALPGVRKTAALTDTAAGVGVDEATANRDAAISGLGGAIENTGKVLLSEQEKREKDANAMANLSAQNQLDSWLIDRIHNPTTGALTVKGPDTLQLTEQVGGEFDQVASTIAGTLTNDKQRLAFQKVQDVQKRDMTLTLERHASGEMQRYTGAELTTFVDNKRNEALANALDPHKVGEALGQAIDQIKTIGPTLGMGPQEIQSHIADTASATHVGVINQLLAQNQTKSAQVYFEETRPQIKGDVLASVEKSLELGHTRNEAQAISDKIIAAGGTPDEQRAAVKAAADGATRDEAMQYVNTDIAQKAGVAKATEEQNFSRIYDMLVKNPDVRAIPPAMLANLTFGQKAEIKATALRLAKGDPVEENGATYQSRMTEATYSPSTFAQRNLAGDQLHMTDGEFKQIMEIRKALVTNQQNKADAAGLSGFSTKDQLLTNTLAQYPEIFPHLSEEAKATPAERNAIAELRRRVDKGVAAEEARTQKKLDDPSIQRVIDKIMATPVTVPNSWWQHVPFSSQYGQPTTTKPALSLQIADVPTAAHDAIVASFKSRGVTPNDLMIVNAYIAQQFGKR